MHFHHYHPSCWHSLSEWFPLHHLCTEMNKLTLFIYFFFIPVSQDCVHFDWLCEHSEEKEAPHCSQMLMWLPSALKMQNCCSVALQGSAARDRSNLFFKGFFCIIALTNVSKYLRSSSRHFLSFKMQTFILTILHRFLFFKITSTTFFKVLKNVLPFHKHSHDATDWQEPTRRSLIALAG